MTDLTVKAQEVCSIDNAVFSSERLVPSGLTCNPELKRHMPGTAVVSSVIQKLLDEGEQRLRPCLQHQAQHNQHPNLHGCALHQSDLCCKSKKLEAQLRKYMREVFKGGMLDHYEQGISANKWHSLCLTWVSHILWSSECESSTQILEIERFRCGMTMVSSAVTLFSSSFNPAQGDKSET